jgi:hypothetical protein
MARVTQFCNSYDVDQDRDDEYDVCCFPKRRYRMVMKKVTATANYPPDPLVSKIFSDLDGMKTPEPDIVDASASTKGI